MRTPNEGKKLRKGEPVEVRQREEGLRGAWYEGVVVESASLRRRVKYKHLVDDNLKDVLEENVRVSKAVEGWKDVETDRCKPKKRVYIRPLPPPLNVEPEWSFCLCVDALYDDAWWEGVIMDNSQNSASCSVFFPDEGDELLIPKENLRVTQDWDENRGRWRVRGHWMLAELCSLCDRRGFSIKIVWYNVRTHVHFLSKVGEWMHGKRKDWIQCLNEVFQLMEREPSRQLIPALNGPRTQSYLNREGSFLSGSHGVRNSSQLRKYNKTHDSSLDEDRNSGAIVCCETVGQEWPLDAVVGEDTPIILSENANELIERIGNGFCNPLESSSKKTYFGKELSKALRSSSHAARRGNSKGSRKAIDANDNERAASAHRKLFNCEVDGIDQIDCLDRVLMKDIGNTANTRQQKIRIDKEVYRDVAMGASLKKCSMSNQNRAIKSPPSEANSKGQTECIDMILLKTSNGDQFNSKNGSKLSHQNSGKRKSLTLTVGRKLLQKPNAGHRSTSTFRPSSSLDAEDLLVAALNYDPVSYSSKEIKAKAKIYLLNQGWRLEVKCRASGERQDMLYVSPKGNIFYSLYQACLAWREEQKVERIIDGHCEDLWVKGSASPSSKEPPLRVKRNRLSSIKKLPKRLWRIDTSQQLPRKGSNNDEIDGASKNNNNRSRQLVSRSKRLRGDGNKKRSVTCEGPSVSELTHGTQTCYFLLNSVARDFELKNTRGEESNSKGSRQSPLTVSGWSSKKRKLNLEASMDVHKQKEENSSCHVWKTMDTPFKWYRMPGLPSTTPRRSNDSSSCQDKPTDIFNLSWLIENGVVDENQQVFFMYGKQGWITCKGILCACCYRVHSLTSFEAHAGSKRHQFSVNLRLDDGRSLAQCQMQALRKRMRASSEEKTTKTSSKENKKRALLNKERMTDPSDEHDDFCFVCRQNGEVTLCDRCTRSFHAECVQPEKIPGTEEWIKWFCPNCRCDICGGGVFSNDENFRESTVRFCDQCECLFHDGCLDDIGMPKLASCPQGKWFCSQKCSEMFLQLRNLVGKVNPVGDGGLSWTLLRSTEEDRDPLCDEMIAEEDSDPLFYKLMAKRKLSVALSVMHECFSRIKEYRTRKDYVEEIIFNRGCERNLLKFQGFYTAILEKGDKLISVATVRVHGKRVAEMPLIATRTQYRRKGMCRLLLNELEKVFISLQIEKIVLPAIYLLECTWKKSFGFRKMTPEEMFDLLKLDIVHFPDTIMLQKILMGASPEQEILTEIRKNKIKKIECHSGKTPKEDDADESSVVIMGTTRSNRLVKQVKRKIGYSCHWEERKSIQSVEHYVYDRQIYNRKMKEKIIISDKIPVLPRPATLESSQQKDIQCGIFEIRKTDDVKSIICRTNSGIADGNCFSNIKADEPILDRPVLEHGSDHVAVNRENASGNSHTVNCNENYRGNCCGHLDGQYSFKYVYTRRRKKKCSGSAFNGEIPSVMGASSKLSFNRVG